MPDLEIEIEGSVQNPLLVLRGEIDVASVVALRAAVDELGAPQLAQVTLDFPDGTVMDSTGLGWLAALARNGCAVSLRSVPPSIRKLLDITGIDGVVSVADG